MLRYATDMGHTQCRLQRGEDRRGVRGGDKKKGTDMNGQGRCGKGRAVNDLEAKAFRLSCIALF